MASHCNHSAARRRYDVSPATGRERKPVLVDELFHAVGVSLWMTLVERIGQIYGDYPQSTHLINN